MAIEVPKIDPTTKAILEPKTNAAISKKVADDIAAGNTPVASALNAASVQAVGSRGIIPPNLFDQTKVTDLAFTSTAMIQASVYRGYSLPVTPGEVYSVSRASTLNNRFQVAFTATTPAAGVAVFGRVMNDAALKIENVTVPATATHMVLYLDNVSGALPAIKVERGPTATAWVAPTATPGEVLAVRDSLNVQGLGATGNPANDDTAKLQAFINKVQGSTGNGTSGGPIQFPPGEYVISDTLNLYRFSGIIKGWGMANTPYDSSTSKSYGTVIRWAGPSDRAMFRVRDYKFVKFQDIRLEGNETTPPLAAIESYRTATDQVGGNSQLLTDNVYIGRWPRSSQGSNHGKVQTGILFNGEDGGNDQWGFYNTSVVGCEVGLDLPNPNSIWGLASNLFIAAASVAGIRYAAAFTGVNLTFDDCAVDLMPSWHAGTAQVYGWWTERAGLIFKSEWAASVHVWGGLWRLYDRPTSNANFFEHHQLTSGAGIIIDGVELRSMRAEFPKLYVRASGGGNANGGFLSVRNCPSPMPFTSLDVASVGGNHLTVDVETPNISVHRKFTTAQTLTAQGNSVGRDGGNLGFYGGAPIAKPTGVAPTPEAIHAALVSLGLIAP